jgi:hypothetical protein
MLLSKLRYMNTPTFRSAQVSIPAPPSGDFGNKARPSIRSPGTDPILIPIIQMTSQLEDTDTREPMRMVVVLPWIAST